MEKNFNLLKAKNSSYSYMTHYLAGSYKKIDDKTNTPISEPQKIEDHDQRLSLVQALNLALEEKDSNKFVEILNKSQTNSKLYVSDKSNSYFKKFINFFLSIKRIKNYEYVKNCTDEFIFPNSNKP